MRSPSSCFQSGCQTELWEKENSDPRAASAGPRLGFEALGAGSQRLSSGASPDSSSDPGAAEWVAGGKTARRGKKSPFPSTLVLGATSHPPVVSPDGLHGGGDGEEALYMCVKANS